MTILQIDKFDSWQFCFFKDTTPSILISQRNKQDQKYNLTFPLAEVSMTQKVLMHYKQLKIHRGYLKFTMYTVLLHIFIKLSIISLIF